MSFPRCALLLCLVALIAGCAAGPDYESPDTGRQLAFSTLAADSMLLEESAAVDEDWWQAFADEQLKALFQKALSSNTDVRAATARVEEAQAVRRIALSSTRPSITAASSGTRSQQSRLANFPPGIPTLFSLFDVGLSAAWEPDLFGRIKRSNEAASAQFEATIEERRSVLQVVLAEVALNYVDLRMAQQQLQLARQQTGLAEQRLRLNQLLSEQQLVDDLVLIQARATVRRRLAVEASLQTTVRAPAVRLAILTGEEPAQVLDALLTSTGDVLSAPAIPVGLASDLLRRRADIRAAERQLAAASANIGVETASLFPQFSLTGGLGSNALELDNLFTGPSEAWNLGAALSWPIVDGGRRDAAVAAARARYSAAFAAYDSAVLDALGDAETAFASYVFAVKEREALEQVSEELQQAVEYSQLRLEADLGDQFAVIDSRDQLAALEAELVAAQRAELVAAINVYRALGGGWKTAERILNDSANASE